MESPDELENLGERLALLQQPRPPKGLREVARFGGVLWDLIKARPDRDLTPPCHQRVLRGDEVNLDDPASAAALARRCRWGDHPGARDHQGSGDRGAERGGLPAAATVQPHHDCPLAVGAGGGSPPAQGGATGPAPGDRRGDRGPPPAGDGGGHTDPGAAERMAVRRAVRRRRGAPDPLQNPGSGCALRQ